MLLSDKTALIYGGGGAVGGAIADAYAREGATVILVGRTAETLLQKTEAIRAAGGKAEFDAFDATDARSVADQIVALEEKGRRIDIMFNAIGWSDTQGAPLAETAFDAFIDCPRLALTTWFVTGTQVGMHMARHGGGVILGITANAAREPYANVGGFGVACAAVEHFLRQLAVEMGPQGVRVANLRSAGSPDAPGVREVFELHAGRQGITREAFEREAAKDVPLRHLPSLAEVADVAVLMALPLARAMTATTFNVTCGAQID